MSINVTVTGNPISVRRSKLGLSDFDKFRKSEKEHRKRLRLQQVNEQYRALSKKILERKRQIGQEQLQLLEKNGNTQMQRDHERRLLEMQERYNDLENIGYAHENAAHQPNAEYIKKVEEQKNRATAKTRGAAAIQQLQETYNIQSPKSKIVERLAKVRNLENQRSQMVSQLPPKSHSVKDSVGFQDNENIIKSVTPSRKKAKHQVTKKVPLKKTPMHCKTSPSHIKTPSRIPAAANNEDIEYIPTTSTFYTSKSCGKNKLQSNSKDSEDKEQGLNRVLESDDNEPRRMIPRTSLDSTRPERIIRHNMEQSESSSEVSSTTTSSSSISDDSSYFSDNISKISTVKKTPKRSRSPVSSKISVYDHKTRQQKTYERPLGLVDKLNVKNKPNAQEMAQEIIELEKRESEIIANKKENAEKRSQDAMLREKARRDYQALMKQLDLLAREERKLRAQQLSDVNNQQVPVPCKSKEDNKKRQKQMDRAFDNILRTTRLSQNNEEIIERPITITPRDYLHCDPTPRNTWGVSSRRKESEESYSEDDNGITSKRKISELLIKIEKLKRSLLQEYGADLPDDIFNASTKSLFNQTSSSLCQQKDVQNNPKPVSASEIQVINMSSCDEADKPVRKFVCKNKKTPANRAPSKHSSKSSDRNTIITRDQEVQVELKEDTIQKARSNYPLEPAVTIISPENESSRSSSCCSDSSSATDLVIDVRKRDVTIVKSKENCASASKDGSTIEISKSCKQSPTKKPVKISFGQNNSKDAFEVSGLLINPNKKEITLLHSKRKRTPKDSSESKKSQSLPSSKVSSPSKKQSTSTSPSENSSPKILQSHPVKPLDKCSTETQQKRYRTQITQVSIDSSTESSHFNSIPDTGNGKLYSSFQTRATSRVIRQLQDNSDTSTTYASPPSAVAGTLLNAMSSSTSVLELLDSSANETIKQKMTELSPVSSPETPSPRTMMIPSNIPRNGKVQKCLKFMSLVNAQEKSGERSAVKNTKTSCSVSRDRGMSTRPLSQGRHQGRQIHPCTCKNPECKLFHNKIVNTQDYALKNCPEILKKYEDLQNVCTERIASLTDLIEKVRNEQKELSSATPEDSVAHSLNQILQVSQTPGNNGKRSLLVRNAQTIHDQLKTILLESQKLISGEGLDLPHLPVPFRDIEKSPSISVDLSRISTSSEKFEDIEEKRCPETAPNPGKPRILSNEQVNIRLDRFIRNKALGNEHGEKSKMRTTLMSSTTAAAEQDKVVKMLQDELLEQSKSINKSVPVDSLKDSDDSCLKSSQVHVNNLDEPSSNPIRDTQSDGNNLLKHLETGDTDFVPLLAGIPKIPRSLAKGSSNGRGRPPVTLISGPYRPEIISPVHELSTIVEFDTPETVNKSQLSTRSPSNKARRKLPASVLAPSTMSLPTKKSDVREPKCKPSVHVAPLPAHRSPQLDASNKSSTKSIEKSPRKAVENPGKQLENKNLLKDEIVKNLSSSNSMCTLPDVHIEHLQQSQDNTDGNFDFRISQISELQSLPDENIDQLVISELYEENACRKVPYVQSNSLEKLTEQAQLASTSSTSFSGISGVSEITTTPSSDLNRFKCPSSPEEMELAFKKWGLGWAIPTLKKTREASALGSSSSSDVTPVNAAARLVSPVKKQQDNTAHDLPEISDVSSISIKHANKSTERSVLVKGRTSTPNRLSNSNSERTTSTLGSFSSELNIIVQNQSIDTMTIPSISFCNKLV